MGSRFFAKEKVNTGRQPEVDLLKALCIFGMIVAHVLLDLETSGGAEMEGNFLTEFFGAATFMTCMGIGMGYMRRQTPAAYLIRGFGLLTIGQFLNILRNAIPNLIAYWFTGKQVFIANAFLILQADILTFAGLAFLLMALLRMCRLKGGAILGVGLVMNVIGFAVWKTLVLPGNYLVNQLLGFFFITKAESYFPLFCYFIFVAFGYFIGGYYPKIKDKNALANRIMLICFPIAGIYYAFRIMLDMPFMPELGTELQYSLKPTPDAIATCVFTLAIIALLYKVTRLMGGKLPKPIMHLSANINSYYCLSYLFITPVQTILVAATGTLIESTGLLLVYSLFVTVACYVLIELNEKYWHIHFATLKGKKLLIFTVAVWVLTIVIAAYAYPRIEVFANIWNEYLMP